MISDYHVIDFMVNIFQRQYFSICIAPIFEIIMLALHHVTYIAKKESMHFDNSIFVYFTLTRIYAKKRFQFVTKLISSELVVK